MLDNAKIAALFGNPSTEHSDSNGKQPKPNCWVKVTETDGSWYIEQRHMPKSEFGKFEGRAGSMRRSRKGRTYHAPNGSRKYNAGEGWYGLVTGETTVEVVAYQA